MDQERLTDIKQFEAELLTKPEIRREFDSLVPKYELIRSIIKRRNELGISQTALAKRIGTKQPAISRLEKGDYNTTLKTFFKVAEALDLEIDIKPRS